MTTATFHPVTSTQTLACDACGCVVDPSDRGRSSHQQWHTQADEVVDLRDSVAELVRRAS